METTFTYDKQVTGKSFIGRKNEKELLCKVLQQGGNIALYEGPKTGKCSLLKQSLYELALKGFRYKTFEMSLLSIRNGLDFLKKLARLFKYELKDDNIFDEDKITEILSLPLQYAEKSERPVIVILFEFQNILKTDDGELILKVMEKSALDARCSWVWIGSQINGMKQIFEKRKFFHKDFTRVKIQPVTLKEANTFLTKGFLISGKVINPEQVERVYPIFKGNIYYLQHFASICDGLSRGYITDAVIEESILSLLSIHEPRFISTVYDLTEFQTNLLKAILDGQTKFSASEIIDSYNLNSSANVKRLKEALCKKEIVTLNGEDGIKIVDPLFEYWLRTYYF